MFTKTARTIGLIAILGAGTALPAMAQQNGGDGSSNGSGQSANDSGSSQSGTQMQGLPDLDPQGVIATVGDTEIVGGDIIDFAASLPPRLREQPPQVVLSMAVEQVILRELLLQAAQSRNLSEDSRVAEIVERDTRIAEEDAMVAVYVEDELANRVTDAEVQQAYAQLQSQAEGQELPALDRIRPQIVQQLEQQALQSLRADLLSGTEVTIEGASNTQ